MEKIIYLTGASGQIGKIVRKAIEKKDLKVFIQSRKKLLAKPNETFIEYRLGDMIAPCKGNYEHIIIHLAHDFYDRKTGYKNINAVGLKKIISSFKEENNKKIIFISTPNVDDLRTTTYTSQKKLLESMLSSDSDLIIRPSLIFSKNEMNNIFTSLPKLGVPIPVNKNRIAPMMVEAFSDKLLEYSLRSAVKGPLIFIGKKSISFKEFLEEYYQVNSFILPNFLWVLLACLLKLTQIPKFFYLSERILGYVYLRDIDVLIDETTKKISV